MRSQEQLNRGNLTPRASESLGFLKNHPQLTAMIVALNAALVSSCGGGGSTDTNETLCLGEFCPSSSSLNGIGGTSADDDTNGSSGANGEGGTAGENGEGKGGNDGVSGAAGETSQGGNSGTETGGNSGSTLEDAGVNDAGSNTGAGDNMDAGTVDAGENQGGNGGASGSAGETGNGGTSGTAGETSQGGNGGTGGTNSMGGTAGGVSGAAGEGGTSGSGGSSGEAGQGGSAGEGQIFCSGTVVDCNNDNVCTPAEDTWASETNCGDCGTVCESGQECSVGICIDENGNGGAGGSNGNDQDLPNHTMVIYDVFPGDAPYEYLVDKKAGELQATINYLNNLADETFECLAAGDCDNTITLSQQNPAFNVTRPGSVAVVCHSLSVPGSIVNISHLPDVEENTTTVTPPDNWMVGVLVDENEIELSTTGPNGEVIEFPFGGTGVRITLEPTDESGIACLATKNGLQAQWIH